MDFTVYDWLFGAAVFVAAFVRTWRWLDSRTEEQATSIMTVRDAALIYGPIVVECCAASAQFWRRVS